MFEYVNAGLPHELLNLYGVGFSRCMRLSIISVGPQAGHSAGDGHQQFDNREPSRVAFRQREQPAAQREDGQEEVTMR
jgi:hypothetical protein